MKLRKLLIQKKTKSQKFLNFVNAKIPIVKKTIAFAFKINCPVTKSANA